MELVKVTDRIWYYPFEQERDRPILGYVNGDAWSLAVDCGHSKYHTLEFYSTLEKAGLSLSSIIVLTHWHWDHSFGMWKINGKCISNERTKDHLMEFKKWYLEHDTEDFLALDESIRKEYENYYDIRKNPVIVTVTDILFIDEMWLDAGNCPILLLQTEAPHTDDSTLIVVENEKVLFLGDAAGGVFPT